VENESLRVAGLVREYVERQEPTPMTTDVNLASLLDEVVEVNLLGTPARSRVRMTCAPALPAVRADAARLKQVVLNLLLNAIETSPAGGRVMLDVRDGAVLGTTAAVVMEVRDHGAGIPADQLEHIFHPFFTTKETGTGLGLALVHQMVVDHGGEIAVESTVGQGTVFRVTLPAAQLELRRTGT